MFVRLHPLFVVDETGLFTLITDVKNGKRKEKEK